MGAMLFTQWSGILIPAIGLLFVAMVIGFVFVSIHESKDVRETIAAILGISAENLELIYIQWGLVPFWIP